MTQYQFNDNMDEISGFGGEYEATCRKMLTAALEWLDVHPDANPQFSGFKGIYGVIKDDNGDGEALSNAAIAGAGEFGPTGAMHQAVISAALWIKTNGWNAYVKAMTHPEGQVGIFKEKLARKSEDYDRLSARFDEISAERDRRGTIIAEKVLGWERYKVSNGEQEAYGRNQAAVNELRLGCRLSELVDGAIKAMRLKGEAA